MAASLGLGRQLLSSYRSLSRRFVYGTAFVTCFVKGSASDAVAQLAVEDRSFPGEFSFRRNFCFALYSGAYCGIAQHSIYNTMFSRWFGSAQTFSVALRKVTADLFIHVPFVYLPVYYAWEATTVFGASPMDGVQRLYGESLGQPGDIVPTMKAYAAIWPAVHLANFTLVPPELRIAVVASVSFAWLVIVSVISHSEQPVAMADAVAGSATSAATAATAGTTTGDSLAAQIKPWLRPPHDDLALAPGDGTPDTSGDAVAAAAAATTSVAAAAATAGRLFRARSA